MMAIAEKLINLEAGPIWPSFEQFRKEGVKALETVKDGRVAILTTKTGQYRILEEHDFQKLLGLARDVERLRGGLSLLLQTVQVVNKHPDTESMNLLMQTVTMLGSLPALPIRNNFEPLMPEGIDVDLDDEVNLDPTQIESPLDSCGAESKNASH